MIADEVKKPLRAAAEAVAEEAVRSILTRRKVSRLKEMDGLGHVMGYLGQVADEFWRAIDQIPDPRLPGPTGLSSEIVKACLEKSFVEITGDSGSGKSTFVKVFLQRQLEENGRTVVSPGGFRQQWQDLDYEAVIGQLAQGDRILWRNRKTSITLI